MKTPFKLFVFVCFTLCGMTAFAQELVASYEPAKQDSIRVGKGDDDYLPYIEKGYSLWLPQHKNITGVLIFLEGSKYDQKNKSAKQMYDQAAEKGFAVLSVSTEIPLDFYFSKSSMLAAHTLIQNVFERHGLPNENIFFLGASLVGHRAMQYIKFMKVQDFDFQLNIKGLVLCNFTMDFTRKWYQHRRDIRINRINLWEPKFINYLLEKHLDGTPETNPERYHNFSPYSYFDQKNRNIKFYKNYAIRAYIEPAIKYKLSQQLRTLYENNATDSVGFLAELELAGNKNTELIVFQPGDNPSPKKNTQSTWDAINKEELMDWVLQQAEK